MSSFLYKVEKAYSSSAEAIAEAPQRDAKCMLNESSQLSLVKQDIFFLFLIVIDYY